MIFFTTPNNFICFLLLDIKNISHCLALSVPLYYLYTSGTILLRDWIKCSQAVQYYDGNCIKCPQVVQYCDEYCTKCTQVVQYCHEMVSSVHKQYNIAGTVVLSAHK